MVAPAEKLSRQINYCCKYHACCLRFNFMSPKGQQWIHSSIALMMKTLPNCLCLCPYKKSDFQHGQGHFHMVGILPCRVGRREAWFFKLLFLALWNRYCQSENKYTFKSLQLCVARLRTVSVGVSKLTSRSIGKHIGISNP